MTEISKIYLAIGAGGVSLIALIYILIYIVRKIYPVLNTISEQGVSYSQIIQNNTQAIREMSKSNDNVASALALLEYTVKRENTTMDKHDERAGRMEIELAKIAENTKNCSK